jgi:glycosyltransferase involved in cell wall biosynthesis
MASENEQLSGRQLKRICHLIHQDGPGGGATTLITHLKQTLGEFDLVFLSGGQGRVAEFCDAQNIAHIKLPIDRLWKCFWSWIPLWWQLRRLNPDILILHGQWAGPLGSLAGKLARVRKMLYIAHWPAFYTDWDLYRIVRNRIVESIPVHLCDRVICISPENLYQYQIRFPDCLGKFVHLRNPYDSSLTPTEDEAIVVREKFGWKKDLVHVVSVGRISTQKHFEWLLQSWVLVQREVPEARLWIVGDGEEEERMHALAHELSIGSSCVFLGAQPKGIEFIKAADIVAMTTLYEGHANIPMEAHACGKPIVANDVDGVRLSIVDGADGYLVPAGDIRDFAEKLILLCRSRELRENIGQAGFKNLKKFPVEGVMNDYKTLIRQLIES